MAKRKHKLRIGKFYYAYGGTKHPAQIYKKDKVHGTYLSIKTGTTQRKDMVAIRPIQKGVQHSYVNKRPFEGTRKDYGDRELLGLVFDPSDSEEIEMIKTRKPRQTRRAKEKYKKMPSSD